MSDQAIAKQPADELPVLRFSTQELPEATRMEYLHDFYSRTRMGVEIAPMVEDEQFLLDLELQPLMGNTWMGRGRMTPHNATRTPGLVSDIGNDGLLLTRSTGPYSYTERHAGELILGATDVLVANFSQTCRYVYPARDNVQTLGLDRKQLLARLPNFDPDTAAKLDGRSPELALLFAYVASIERTGVGNGMLGQVAALHLADLAALALGAQGDYAEAAREGGQKAARLAAIRAELETRFQDAELTAASVAQRHCISVRYLHVLFEQSGQTFSDFILERRLRYAMSRLSDPRCRHLRIADIAFDAGFSDLTTFNRCFRRRFGDTPSSVRP